LAFFVMLPFLKRTLTITLDTDWLWRRVGPALYALVQKPYAAIRRLLGRELDSTGRAAGALVLRHYGQDGRLARTWSTRSMALWVLVLLIGYLLLYYI